MLARRVAAVLVVLAAGCSSSSSDGGGATPSGASTPTLDRTKKLNALVAADLPLLCDAWAMNEGGYGSAVVKKDCGNAMASESPPTSQADCVSRFQSNPAMSSCAATVGGFLDCHAALYMNPCATVGEAPSCTGALDPSCGG